MSNAPSDHDAFDSNSSGEKPHASIPVARTDCDCVDLVRAAQAGDKVSLERLMDQFMPTVFGIAMWVLRNIEDANDVVQLVWMIVMAEIVNVREPERFPGWLRRITVRKAGEFRRKKGRQIHTSDLHDHIPSFGDGVMDRYFDEHNADEKVENIIQGFAKGKGKRNRKKTVRRIRVILACESYREAAQILGCSEGSVRATHHKLFVWARSNCLEYVWDEDDKWLGRIAHQAAARGAKSPAFVVDKTLWSDAFQKTNDLKKYEGREFFFAVVCSYRQLGGRIDWKAVNLSDEPV